MTISNTKRAKTYIGNGSTTEFPYDFFIPDEDSLKIYTYEVATGTKTLLSASAYDVDGIGEETFGSVTYPNDEETAPLASTHWLIIVREVGYTQDTAIPNQSAFFPEVLEAQLDDIVMQIQQLAETLDRVPQMPEGQVFTEQLANKIALANKYLQFDANGEPRVTALLDIVAASDKVNVADKAADGSRSVDEWISAAILSGRRPQPWDYGVAGDGSDDTQKWQDYFGACVSEGAPITCDRAILSSISDTLTIQPAKLTLGGGLNDVSVLINLENVAIKYTGTRNRPWLDIGANDDQIVGGILKLPSLFTTGTTWPLGLQDDDVAVRLTFMSNCLIFEPRWCGMCSKGVEYVNSNYNSMLRRHIIDCKYGRIYTTNTDDPNFHSNENTSWGGKVGCTSNANSLGDAYGDVFTWNKIASYRGQNNNRCRDTTFEMGSPSGTTHRVPVLLDGAGSYNEWTAARMENCKGPFAICDGGLHEGSGTVRASHNKFHALYSINGGTGNGQRNVLNLNGALNNIYEDEASVRHRWESGNLSKRLASAGTTSAYIKGQEFFFADGATPSASKTSTGPLSHRNGLALGSNIRVGVEVDTSLIKTFEVNYAAHDSFVGRLSCRAFDADGAALSDSATDDAVTPWLPSTEYTTFVSNDGGKVYQLVTPGTSAGSGGPTGTGTGIADNTCVWDYVGTTATVDEYITAWTASRDYTRLFVTNDTGKVYQLTECGTSASPGGPTGTGSGITDGTCEWNYVAASSADYIIAPWLEPSQQSGWGKERYVKGFSSVVGVIFVDPSDGVPNRFHRITAREEVKSIWTMIGGGSNPLLLYSFDLLGFSVQNKRDEAYPSAGARSALRVYSPLDDHGDVALASAKPDTSGIHGYHGRGTRVGHTSAAVSAAPGFACVTTGWLAPAWTISTAYAVLGLLVTNDSGKIYQLVTAGTSAGSGGPTGTGSGITDGTCEWDYIGVLAEYGTEAVLT